MNRILFEKSEISQDGIATFGGERAEHILKVLHGEVGQKLKTGEIGGLIGSGEIIEISKAFSDTPLQIKVKVSHENESLKPWIDLVLAPPRPRVLKRLLPQLSALGVGRIVLVGAKKVEKDFWGATLLKEEIYRPLVVDGLMQSGTSIPTEMISRRQFRKFLAEELDDMFPNSLRIVAHPYEEKESSKEAGALKCSSSKSTAERVLLAVGPEGGWTDDEVQLLEEKGFSRYSLGARILRTDTATVALIAQLMDRR